MKISTSNLLSSITFTALLSGFAVHAQAAEQSVSYFNGKENRTMSVTSSTFTPTHPECCTPKAPKEPFVIPAPKEEVVPPAPIIESDSDNDGVVDSNDQCPDTPKGYKVDTKGCPSSVTLHLNFASNSSILPASAEADIATLSAFMEENPAATMSIIGHTDSSGSNVKNQTLSENRAKSLGSRLIQNNITSDRIKMSGKGSSEPIVSNKTPAGRAENRRIQILIR